jgi:hypothetical protein
MGLFGLILLALGWSLLESDSSAKPSEQRRDLSPAQRRELGFEVMRHGARWLVGGVVVTGVTYQMASLGGGKYLLTWGPILYGISKIIHGAVQVHRAEKD